MFRRTAVILTLLLLPAAAARADEVYLEDGEVFRGEILDVTDEAVVMSIEGLEGSRVELPLSRVSDYGLYLVMRDRIDSNSAKDRIELGDWAEAKGMHSIALDEYRVAKRLLGGKTDPELERKISVTEAACGQDQMERARTLMDEGDLVNARDLLRDVRDEYPECPAAKTAKELLPDVNDRIRAERERERKERREEEVLAEVDDRLAMVDDLIARGDRMRRLGYLDSGDLGDAEDDFLEAIRAYRKSREVLEGVADLPRAEERKEARRKRGKKIRGRLLEVYVDVGHNFIVKGNLVKANHYMGRALAIDANDPKALALRQAIAEATSEERVGRVR